jgi:hypothetical protein
LFGLQCALECNIHLPNELHGHERIDAKLDKVRVIFDLLRLKLQRGCIRSRETLREYSDLKERRPFISKMSFDESLRLMTAMAR